jgi:hypothetical protein
MKFSKSLKSLSTDDYLMFACFFLIVSYVAIATPQNTPSLFAHPLVKAAIFVLVIYVCHQNMHLGLAFGLAMVLTICYSNLNVQSRSIDGFVDFNTKAIDELMDKITTTVPQMATTSPSSKPKPTTPVIDEEHHQPLYESFMDNGLDFQPLDSSLQASEFIS